MKPRRVLITLEVTTEKRLSTLRDKNWWRDSIGDEENQDLKIHQVQVNVIKEKK